MLKEINHNRKNNLHKVITIFLLTITLTNSLIISHKQQLSYRLGTNYAGSSSN